VDAGAPTPRANSPLTGYATSFGTNQQHINFIDATSGHVWELMFDTAWHPLDLTNAAGAPVPNAASPLTAYPTTFNSQQHVDFIGADNHVHELFFDSAWHWSDLNVKAGIPGVSALTSALNGYVTSFNEQQHVNFVTSNGHVRELFFFEEAWHARDLTTVTAPPAPPASITSRLTGYETTFNSQEHVNYVGTNGHVYELFFDKN
jgi:hypothetical protein